MFFFLGLFFILEGFGREERGGREGYDLTRRAQREEDRRAFGMTVMDWWTARFIGICLVGGVGNYLQEIGIGDFARRGEKKGKIIKKKRKERRRIVSYQVRFTSCTHTFYIHGRKVEDSFGDGWMRWMRYPATDQLAITFLSFFFRFRWGVGELQSQLCVFGRSVILMCLGIPVLWCFGVGGREVVYIYGHIPRYIAWNEWVDLRVMAAS